MIFHFYDCGCCVAEEGVQDERIVTCHRHVENDRCRPEDALRVEMGIKPLEMPVLEAMRLAKVEMEQLMRRYADDDLLRTYAAK